ncbi:beta propeller repeat protein [Humibacter ginsengisoli]
MARTRRTSVPGRMYGPGRTWAIAGLIVFVVVDVLLVAWALASVNASPKARKDPATAVATNASTPRPTPTATKTQAAIPNAVAPTRVLSALDDQVAWRATTGACPATAAGLEHTTDGGGTWQPADAGSLSGASSVLRITVASNTEAAAITLDKPSCAVQYMRTYVAGANWATYNDQLTGSWYLDPSSPTTVHSPQGNVPAPCPSMVGLAVRDASSAAVLCANHTVYRTSNAGAGWGAPLAVPGAVAVTAFANGYATAAGDIEGCAGVSVSSLDSGNGAATTSGCFATAAPQPGAVAMASGGSTLWLWAGDALARSSDGGASWH